MSIPRIILSLFLACILVLSCATKAIAFCGFYIRGADARLFDRASQVVIGCDGDRHNYTLDRSIFNST